MTESKTLAQLEAIDQKLPMSRRDKLLHFAAIVQRLNSTQWYLLHKHMHLESKSTKVLRAVDARDSVLGLALTDPVFQEAGITGTTIGGVIDFLDITRHEMHSFACGCHNHNQSGVVDQVKHLASVNRPKGFFGWLLD